MKKLNTMPTQPTAALVVLTLVVLQTGCTDRSPGDPSTLLPPAPAGSPQPDPVTGSRRLSGRVFEFGSAQVPVAGVAIEVMGVPDSSVVTSWHGHYRLDVPVGAVTLRIRKDGFHPREETIDVIGDTSKDFELTLIRPHDNVDGTYSLTIAAADQCRVSDGLPAALWTRTYQATVAQNGSVLKVTLGGAAFEVVGRLGDNFHGRIEPSRLTFFLNQFKWSAEIPPYVVEQVDSGWLVIDGEANVDLPITQRTGTLAGRFELLATNPYSWNEPRTLARCDSDRHRFTLSR